MYYVCIMILLTESAIGLIRSNKALKKELLDEFGYSERILYRDLKNNNARFTQYGALCIIAKHTNLRLVDILSADPLPRLS